MASEEITKEFLKERQDSDPLLMVYLQPSPIGVLTEG